VTDPAKTPAAVKIDAGMFAPAANASSPPTMENNIDARTTIATHTVFTTSTPQSARLSVLADQSRTASFNWSNMANRKVPS
jgi:hypothetical protein